MDPAKATPAGGTGEETSDEVQPPAQSELDHDNEEADRLREAVDRLARGTRDAIEGLLVSVGDETFLDGTLARCRTHFVVRDANSRPRVRDLATRLADQALDYCIPRSRLQEARDHLDATGSHQRLTRLVGEARQLFTRLERSGEGGELLLYLLLESVLGIPQVLCKMPLKTNSQMHVHGTDGIHAKFRDDGVLAVYWGESKVYASVEDAIDDCIASIAAYLLDDGDGAAQRDILLARDNLDTGMADVTQALIKYFSDEAEERARLEFRGACLVAFDYDDYPDPFEGSGSAVRADVRAAVDAWYDRFRTRIARHKLEAFVLEVFCVPVPSADEFRASVRKALGLV